MSTDLLTKLTQQLDAPASRYAMLDRYYAGEQPLAYLAPDARQALGNRLKRVSVNIPRLLVDSLAERLRVTGFDGADMWPTWLACDLDQTSGIGHREALALSRGFVIVWANPDGSPNASVESARQVTVIRDPGTRRVVAALKRWETETTTEATVFEPDRITRLSAAQTGATVAGFRTVETLPNPLGWVPVVELANHTRLAAPRSEMSDVLDLTDALVKLTTDMLVGSEFGARPRRWATGLELEENDDGEAVSPIAEGDRLMINEAPEGKFGQLAGSDLAAYENAIAVVLRQISAVSGLPEHVLGIGADNPTSADSIRASEAALTARAEAKQATFGRAWETVARLLIAVRDRVDPESVDVRVRWADASTRSTAQEADAVTKLFAAGLLPATAALARLGYTQTEIDDIRAQRRAEALDSIGADIAGLVA